MKWVRDGDLVGERDLPGKFWMKEDVEDNEREEQKEQLRKEIPAVSSVHTNVHGLVYRHVHA